MTNSWRWPRRKFLIASSVLGGLAIPAAICAVYAAEIGGWWEGQMAVRHDNLVVHYQRPNAPQILWRPAMKLLEEEYGFTYRGGFNCRDGSWENRWYGSKNHVVRSWLEGKYGRKPHDILTECLERVCLRDYGVPLDQWRWDLRASPRAQSDTASRSNGRDEGQE